LEIVFLAFYQNIEANFSATFENNGKARKQIPEAYMFDTLEELRNGKLMMLGLRKILKTRFYLQGNKLSRQGQRNFAFEEFVSDPKSQFHRRYQPAWNHASKIHD
jgi:hypothetical protein